MNCCHQIVFVFLFFLSVNKSIGQTDSTLNSSLQFNKVRTGVVVGTESVLYASTLYGLNNLWYKNYPRSNFHFFNDNFEWLQMDKIGHATTSYYVGIVGIDLLNWSGVQRKKAIWFGGILGSVFQSTIEIMDGFSSEWGFSVGDFAANTSGSILVIGEQLLWNQQRIVLKYSFHQSEFSNYRPEVLGKNKIENLLKDYNGQTYWLSLNLSSFMKKETKFPSWLNVALGYGAQGMTGGNFNPPYINDDGQQIYFDRYRQFYISLDADLTRIKTKSNFLKTIFKTIGFIKLPAPSIEINKLGLKGNWIGF